LKAFAPRRSLRTANVLRNFIIYIFLLLLLFFSLGWDVRHLEHDVIYWDIVVVTTLDIVQKDAYDALIQQRSTINRIPLGVDYLVITDPGKIGKSLLCHLLCDCASLKKKEKKKKKKTLTYEHVK
jgi:hypothetical protein